MTPRKKLKFLVVGYLGCAVTNHSSDKSTLLSDQLVQFARNGGIAESKEAYAGFYGVTNVCYKNVLENYSQSTKYDPEIFHLSNISKNFSAMTKLKCITVSTPDDENGPEDALLHCGSGYEGILKPLEENNFEGSMFSHTPTDIDSIPRSLHLINIAKHAAAHFPEAEIQLDYVDYKPDHWKSVAKIDVSKLPANVAIDIFKCENVKNKKIEKVNKKKIQNTSKPSALQMTSVFKSTTDYNPLSDTTAPTESKKDDKSNCCILM